MYPTDLKYTHEHEWLREEGGEAVVGITDFAQAQLGDVVFVDLPAVGRVLEAGEVFGTIESVKAVSELFSPVAGEVTAINGDLANHPELVNQEPYKAWMMRIRPAGGQIDGLLDAAAYEALVK
jgi:glycine cleavage system H protein